MTGKSRVPLPPARMMPFMRCPPSTRLRQASCARYHSTVARRPCARSCLRWETQLAGGERVVDRVAPVVAEAVGHEGDLLSVGALAAWAQLIEDAAEVAHEVEVAAARHCRQSNRCCQACPFRRRAGSRRSGLPRGSSPRTFCPCPYTGSGFPVSAQWIMCGISFSGYWKGP